jgi:hypothetical protein
MISNAYSAQDFIWTGDINNNSEGNIFGMCFGIVILLVLTV